MPTSRQAEFDELIDAWWALYCPTCRTRYRTGETACPRDGETLRHVSMSAVLDLDTVGSLEAALADTGGRFASISEFVPKCTTCGSLVHPDETSCPHDGTALGTEKLAGRLEGRDVTPRGVIGDKWRLVELRGAGSFGRFYEGQHHILGMKVGVKVLRSRFTATEQSQRLFHQEAMRISLLDHPNIVRVFDYGDEDGVPYLVMEYLEGRSLADCFCSRDLDVDDGVEVIRQATRGLISAHRGTDDDEPLVHLDLKPEHIFLQKRDGDLHAKIIDFGIAEIASAARTASGPDEDGQDRARITGTPPYMGPERFRGVIDPRSDLYALGVILYELIAGRKPFDGETLDALREQHERVLPPPPSRYGLGSRSRSDRKLDRIVLWTLEKELADRPATAEQFLTELDSWVEYRERERRAKSWSGRARRWSAALVFLALATLGLLYWGPWKRIELSEAFYTVPHGESPTVLRLGRVKGEGYGACFIEFGTGPDQWSAKRSLLASGPNGILEYPMAPLAEFERVFWGGPLPSRELWARIAAQSSLGRSLRSEPFKIRFEVPRASFRFPPEDLTVQTNESYSLSFELENTPELVRVDVDGKELQTMKDQEGRAVIAFENNSRKRVSVKAWSRLSDLDGPPDDARIVTVRFLSRPMTIETPSGTLGEPTLNRFVVLTGGVALPDEEYDWALHQVQHVTSKRAVEAAIDPDSGEISIRSEERGAFEAVLQAVDGFGNSTPRMLYHFYFPARPVVRELRVVGPEGTRARPLHPLDCHPGPRAPIGLRIDVDYPEPQQLRASLWFHDALVMEFPGIAEGDLRIDPSRIARVLEVGKNEFELRLHDSRDEKHLRAVESFALYHGRFDVTVSPDDGIVLPDEFGKVKIDIQINGLGRGDSVEAVLVDGKPADVTNAERAWYSFDVEVPLEGSEVEIVARSTGRVDHSVLRNYRRLPVDGETYRFRIPIEDRELDLDLEFHRESADGQLFRGYWFTTDAGWQSIRQFFSKELSEPGPGVTFREADELVGRLARALRDGGWIGAETVDLPTLRQLRELARRRAVPLPPGRREWLSNRPPEGDEYRIPQWDVVFAVAAGESARIDTKGAEENDDKHRCAFRVVIPYGKDESRLKPWNVRKDGNE